MPDEQQPAEPAEPAASGTRPTRVTRREFVAGVVGAAGVAGVAGAAALVGLRRRHDAPLAGGFADDGSAAGHALRDRAATPAVRRVVRTPVVIVGGGAAGLSAAWWLRKGGLDDFVVLELAREAGGNARGGENAVSAYPWGAHYLPLPGPRATLVRQLCEEMGMLVDGQWRERDLCFAPQERTLVHGRWREGLEEAVVLGREDHDALRRFADDVATLRVTGEFTIPMALGARESSALDAVTADAWLASRGYRSPALRWLVDYACRDDFGTTARDTSAWAAFHYFAARDAGDEHGPLTWPEGNARLVRHLASRAGERVVAGAPVHRVARAGSGAASPMRVLAGDVAYECDVVVWAAPTFVARHVVEGAPPVAFRYAPWLVTNVTLERRPRDLPGVPHAPRAWDNVIADSPALGYIDATHQSLRTAEGPTVWTHYWALAEGDPAAERRRLYAADWRTCAEWVLADLERAHPDVRACVRRVDVLRYGHAMPRPEPGFLAARAGLWRPPRDARVLWANSDVSGLSLFEEAQYRGVEAAERALALVGRG